MKRSMISLCVVMLTACQTVPVTQSFPKASATLMTPPPALKQIPAEAPASVVFDTVIENYGIYHEIANQLQGWQQWYEEQRKIFEGARK